MCSKGLLDREKNIKKPVSFGFISNHPEVNFTFKDTSTVGRPGDMQPRLLWCIITIIIYRNFSIEIVIVCLLY